MSEKFSVPLNESWSASDETLHRCVFNYEAAYAEGMEPTGRLMLNRSEHLFHILPSVESFVRLLGPANPDRPPDVEAGQQVLPQRRDQGTGKAQGLHLVGKTR